MFPNALRDQAKVVLDHCRKRGLKVATAESCTGGLIAACLTEIAGSSEVVDRGYVVYSNAAKQALLGVPEALLVAHGAVSVETAEALVAGVLAMSPVDLAVAATGIAGPGGATAEKPVGLVYLAAGRRGGPVRVARHLYPGDRQAVRLASVAGALTMLNDQAMASA
jgi:nicotinamide-nucleotide amidase